MCVVQQSYGAGQQDSETHSEVYHLNGSGTAH